VKILTAFFVGNGLLDPFMRVNCVGHLCLHALIKSRQNFGHQRLTALALRRTQDAAAGRGCKKAFSPRLKYGKLSLWHLMFTLIIGL
jgi:hypothetical protein